MKNWSKYIPVLLILMAFSGIFTLNADRSIFSMETPEVSLVEEEFQQQDSLNRPKNQTDTTKVKFPVAKIAPDEYKDLTTTHPIDLQNPQSFDDEFYYDAISNRYVFKAQVGGMEITTPLTLTPEEYRKYSYQKSMNSYFKKKNQEEFDKKGEKEDVLSGFDFKFDLGPAEKIFGPGGVKLSANGSVDVKMGVTRTSNGNPTLSESQRNRTTFDFDSQIQAGVEASVGDRVGFNLNYNTESTFDFDSRQLKLGYEGKEDEIIKVLEAGNVSMNTSNSLIRGGASLFGIKTELQFGKLNIGAVFSQQEAESSTVSARGKIQTTPFEIKADAYEENRHFFLSQYFRDNYDKWMKTLPMPTSGIKVTKLEVWVTNKSATFEQAHNVVAFTDLGENAKHISNKAFVHPTGGDSIPSNGTNDLYATLITPRYAKARNINTVNQAFQGTSLESGRDYEKIDKARRLTSTEYIFNAELGYISLTGITLQSDEVLAVAFEYKNAKDGLYYQVGEFSSDNTENTDNNLYLKLLKGVSMSPDDPYWDLMMKNAYYLGNMSIEPDRFKLNIKYQNDTTGTYLNYIPEGNIANQLLLRVMNLDRLDATGNPNPDGYYDYLDGYTIQAQQGVIIFPVIEPFGSHLRTKIGDDNIADKYVFQALYDSTLTVARQMAERNKFVLVGEYKGSSSGGGINMGGSMIAPGSVRVTANGVALIENVHYTVDYATGNVTVIDPTYENANIQVSSENHSSGSSMQRKTMMGLNMNYDFNPNFSIGATIMRLSEMPLTMKMNMGEEAIANTIYGFNFNYSTQSQWLTNLIDKLPFTEATAPSQITLSGEFAQLLPGHYESEYGGKYSYIDDFENAEMPYDWRAAYNWNLSSTPWGDLFPESKYSNDIRYGYNRSLFAWYYIDGLFTRSSTMTPPGLTKDDLSNHYVREVKETELFPNRRQTQSTEATIPVLNLAFYPKERGPYNLDVEYTNVDGTLMNPEKRWGGITRRIDSGQTDFEATNIENIEFWLLDPFIYEPNSPGGDLYFNLGEISEDVLKDERKSFENGLPLNPDDLTQVDSTVWGSVPKIQPLNYAFDNTSGAREAQDVGLNGLSAANEKQFSTYAKFLEDLKARLNPSVWDAMLDDKFSPRNSPSGDIYHFFRGSDYDDERAPILKRYKRYNGTEGNSKESDQSGEKYNTAAKLTPDVEDINQDNNLNENEKYFQYKVSIRPQDTVVGKNFIVDKRQAKVLLKNGKEETVNWYQFKIPIRNSQNYKNIGNIKDFKTVRFARMFLTNFSDSVILRFGELGLVRGDWRNYLRDLSNPNMPSSGTGALSTSTVNIEENDKREPVSYVTPPGVNRTQDPSQPQQSQQNEQSLAIRVTNLESGDARAIYKNTAYDFRQYKRIQMFTHAERLKEDFTSELRDDEFSIFIRLGSDYKNNYYEYEIPLKLTKAGQYSQNSTSDRAVVWPEENMFDFPFEILTDLKLQRNRDKRQAGSTVSYQTPYSTMDPNKLMNKITVVGNPSIAEVKVIMVGVRNNSMNSKSAEVWVNEMRLTEFNEENGWAANGNLFVGLSDMGTFNFKGSKETAGFGSLDQGIMERNIDDHHQFSVMTSIDAGRLFPEKAKIKAPFHYNYEEDVTSPKYNPLDQDILLKQAIDEVQTSAEKDSIKGFAQTKAVTKEIGITSFNVDIKSKNPMPYDPANFTLGYVYMERNNQDATTTYDRETMTNATFNYMYSPMIKTVEPFKNIKSKSGATKLIKDFGFNYMPGSYGFTSDISRNYYEVQLRDLNSPGENLIGASYREDFYWNRGANVQWNLTKNLTLAINTGTKARIDAPHVQVNKNYNRDEYKIWKDSVIQSLKDLGTPLNYNQVFNADYAIPFKLIPALNFLGGALSYSATYNWEKGAQIQVDEGENPIEIGNTIQNERTIGLNNLTFNFVSLYEKSHFLSEANKKFAFKRLGTPTPRRSTARTGRGGAQDSTAVKKQEKKQPVVRKKFESEVALNLDSATIVNHNLGNKRLRLTARGEDGKLYELKFKSLDKNSIQIKNKDSVKLNLAISQLPPIEETTWYKVAQVAARGLMMVRSAGVSYSMSNSSIIPNFSPNVGDFLGQSSTAFGKAPGWDYAFGFSVDEGFLDKAATNNWLLSSSDYISPAIFNENETFSVRVGLEPFTGFRVDLNADRVSTSRREVDFMTSGSPVYGGSFNITTIAIGSSFETPKSSDGYRSKTFDKFRANRQIIYNRLESAYMGTQYPSEGFMANSPYAGQNFNPSNGDFNMNSQDVLIPAFIAAYTGKDPNNVSLSAFPSLSQILPNWKVTYDGLMQMEFFNRHFKNFLITHQYNCKYLVGNYTSHGSWVDNSSGLGFIQSQASGAVPSSPYSISAASITEAFNPLIAIDGTFRNNMTLKFGLRKTRNVNLNVSSNQIIEINQDNLDVGMEYKISEFNKIVKFKKSGGNNFSNDLKLSGMVTFQRMSNLIRRIQDAYTQASAGESQTMIRLAADYNLSKALTIQAFYDRQVTSPLVTTTSYPMSKSSFGININLSLMQ